MGMYPGVDVENAFTVLGEDLCNTGGIGYWVAGLRIGQGFDQGTLPSVTKGVDCLKHFLGLVLGMLRVDDGGNSSLVVTKVPIDSLPYLLALVLVCQPSSRCM
jgi:hypothetical protein